MKKFIKFLAGGGLSYFIKIVLTFLLTDMLKLYYLLSYSITMGVALLIGFYYHFYFTFKNAKDKKNKFIVYAISLMLFTLIDIYFVKILTESFKIYYIFSIMISTPVWFIIKFIVYDKWVFIDYQDKGGNYFNKFESKNPLIKYLLKRFHKDLSYFIRKIRIKNLLDAGCGEGYTTANIKRKFPDLRITAIEYDKATIDKAMKINANLKVQQGDIYNIQYKNNTFDVVLASEVLEHLEDPSKAIKECKRVSKRYCIFSVPNEPWWSIANIARLAYLSRFGNTPGHIQHWSKNRFKKMLKKHFKRVIIRNSILWNIALCEKGKDI